MTKFSVDTYLFRELGELLVGRESTALIELVKNAYDADATEVSVHGEALGDPVRGVITVSDNGVGMDHDTFVRGFLRIASRMKKEGERRSTKFGRRFTGAKGVGRLAAHKLAKRIDILSTPFDATKAVRAITAHIDWDEVERAETLEAVEQVAPNAISVKESDPKIAKTAGTRLKLSRLRQKWTKTQLTRFLLEVEGLRAPPLLTAPLAKTIVDKVSLFERPTVVDAGSADPGLTVRLEGEFEIGDSYWPAVLETAGWLLEIDATAKGVRYAVVPTLRTTKQTPDLKPTSLSERHPAPEEGPFFHARILIREGAAGGKAEERAWSSRVSGIRVYMEGFRVLPYGDQADDWLAIGRDNSDRSRKLRFLDDSEAAAKLEQFEDEGLLLLPNKHYYGAVFLTADRAGSLEMLVNREGFVPDAAFETLVRLVRRGVDISTRVRAAAKATVEPDDEPQPQPMPRPIARTNADDSEEDAPEPSPPKKGPGRSLKAKTEGFTQRLVAHAADLKALASEVPPAVGRRLLVAAAEIEGAADTSRQLIPSNTMVLVLASVGTQLAAFTHEVNRLLSIASDLESVASRLRQKELPASLRQPVASVVAAAGDLRRAIERQAAYLVDIVTPDARRRRGKLRFRDVLDGAWRFVAPVAERRSVRLKNEIAEEHKSPPMFKAELMAVFTNLLTNAVKAAGEDGAIRAQADQLTDGGVRVRLENTGAAVDVDDAERWFRPFESTTVEVDPVLGQGMGLGLGITRDLLAEVGATIMFVKPRKGYATALEITFPGSAR